MEFNWIKIDNGDWKCELPNGDMLRVERMNRYWVWWCFYHKKESHHCYDFDTPQNTTIEGAKLSVETEYKKKAASI